MKYIILMVLLFSGLCQGVAQSAKGLQLSANVSESGCAGTLHTVAIQADGGLAPYTYQWSDGASGRLRNDLKGGTYTCTVSDSQGKVKKKVFNLPQLPAELTAQVKQEQLGGGTNVRVSVSGGQAPYQYFWFVDGLETKPSQNSTLFNLKAGAFMVVVRDAKGCSSSISFTVK